MKAHIASLINAVALISLSLWGYFSSDTPSPTALIPTGIGVILLVLNNGVKKVNAARLGEHLLMMETNKQMKSYHTKLA